MRVLIRFLEWLGNLRLIFSRKGNQTTKSQDEVNEPDDNIYPLW